MSELDDFNRPIQPQPPFPPIPPVPPIQTPAYAVPGVHQQSPVAPNVTVNVTVGQYGSRVRRVNAVAYLVLEILFGVFGVHRFYRGSIGMGVLYLVTGGLFGIGWLVDLVYAIIWVTQMDADGQITFVDKKYVPAAA